MEQLHGILVLDKPKGYTSAKAISALKRLGQKKIGHAGTLDPMAKGVLLVLLGQATKLSNYLLDGGKKIYEGELVFGKVTDTWDIEGEIIEENDTSLLEEEKIRQEVAKWLGNTSQIVPPYSAAKHKGQPLYKLAREGKEVPVKIKEINISQAEILSLELPNLRFVVECSSGSYIRSLAHSLGQRVSCGACLTALNRLYSHPFKLEEAVNLENLLDNPETLQKHVYSIATVLEKMGWKVIKCNEAIVQEVLYGKAISHEEIIVDNPGIKAVEFGTMALFEEEDGTPLALMQANYGEGFSVPVWTILRGLWR